jgi:hypothetical protein
VEEVGRLSDHVLADIGIARHQVGAIFALREPTRGMTEHAPIDGGLAIADRFGGMSLGNSSCNRSGARAQRRGPKKSNTAPAVGA